MCSKKILFFSINILEIFTMIHSLFCIIVVKRPISFLVTKLFYFQLLLGEYSPLIKTTYWWLVKSQVGQRPSSIVSIDI